MIDLLLSAAALAAPTNIARVQAWRDGTLYALSTAPDQVSDVALEPGEKLVAIAAGDTARWVIGDTVSGSGAGMRVHVLVKPSMAGLRTNLVITTDRRVYHLQLRSVSRAPAAAMAWTYPGPSPLLVARPVLALGVPIDGAVLNFGYRITGARPSWRPMRAFDDGRQTFIEFPQGLATGEAPPLFLTGAGGKPELINYRLRGRYYVVDRLFDAAELRHGGKRQQVVRVIRIPAPRKRAR
jgi:P-type conjugative transfer protein TrbG